MPIRFRCAYCNQLLGIARRKAGTVVRCPTCAGQVIVPQDIAISAEMANDKASPSLFEESDFEDLFQPGGSLVGGSADAPVVLQGGGLENAWGTHGEPKYNLERLPHAVGQIPQVGAPIARPPGFVLTRGKIVQLVLLQALLLMLVFGAGTWLGYVLGKESPAATGAARENQND